MLAPSLADALAALGRDWSAATRIPVTFELAPPDLEVPDEVANEILLIVREALHNIAAHAQARSVTLAMSYQDGQLGVEVGDDGRGFVPGYIADGRTGLAEMRDRARFISGELRVDSEPGNGTLIAIVVPVAPLVDSPPVRTRGPFVIAGAVAGIVAVIAAGILLLRPSSGEPLLSNPSASGTQLIDEPLVSADPLSPFATVTPTASGPAPSRTTRPTAVGSATCKVAYVKRSEWAGGFTADVTITNLTSAQIMGWRLVWAFPGNQSISGFWNTRLSQQGTAVTAEDANSNQKIKAGESATFGFQASFSGSNTVPATFSLNGKPCRLA